MLANLIKGTKTFLNATEPMCVIMGNESCDLDSAVCSLSLAIYYQQFPPTTITDKRHFLPVFNIPRHDFPLKTEVVYFMQQHQITTDVLTFRDELQQESVKACDFILVDHHVSPFAKQCVEVYDHRPFDASSGLPESCKLTLEQVGSCATLIAETILKGSHVAKFADVLKLLHAAIVMDTVNFSLEAARATAKDNHIAQEIEKVLRIDDFVAKRLQIFSELCTAREDVSALSAHQLLYKDMKLIGNKQATLKVALPGYPIRVQDFLLRQNAADAVKEFARQENCGVVLLIGMKVEQDGSVKRDIGLVNISNHKLFDKILNKLLFNKDPDLCLQEIRNCSFLNGKFFEQKNVKVTRKHILPIVKSILDDWNETENC